MYTTEHTYSCGHVDIEKDSDGMLKRETHLHVCLACGPKTIKRSINGMSEIEVRLMNAQAAVSDALIALKDADWAMRELKILIAQLKAGV